MVNRTRTASRWTQVAFAIIPGAVGLGLQVGGKPGYSGMAVSRVLLLPLGLIRQKGVAGWNTPAGCFLALGAVLVLVPGLLWQH
jgi:hypothetical protein